MTRQGFFSYNNGQIYYEIKGAGEPIIFLHGFSLDHHMWLPQVEFFKNYYQTITYDMRGFGRSSVPTGTYSHHDDLKNLFGYLKISKAHLVGLSLGGEIAIDFAIEYPLYLKSLTLIDSSLGGYVGKVDWRVYAQEHGLEKAKQNWLNHDVFKPTKHNKEAFHQLETISTEYSGWHWLNHDPREKVIPSAVDRLHEITVDTQIVLGEKDLNYYHQIAKILQKQIKNSKVVIIPNVGHLGNLENSNVVNHLISNNLKQSQSLLSKTV